MNSGHTKINFQLPLSRLRERDGQRVLSPSPFVQRPLPSPSPTSVGEGELE